MKLLCYCSIFAVFPLFGSAGDVISQAIASSNPRPLFSLHARELAQLMGAKDQYQQQARTVTRTAHQNLKERFDNSDAARLGAGAGMLLAGGLALNQFRGFMRYLNEPVIRHNDPNNSVEPREPVTNGQLIKYGILGGCGVILAAYGIQNCVKAATKYDRMKAYSRALMVENSLQEWLNYSVDKK